jgi:5'-methylthioadenosine phosphorylase
MRDPAGASTPNRPARGATRTPVLRRAWWKKKLGDFCPRRCYKPRMSKHRIGIIGGTGLYHIEGFSRQKWVKFNTPFGQPSDALLTGQLAGRDVVFLPRHGRGHRLLPGELNHRANIWAMKKLGVAWIVSVSAVGSLQARYKPRDIVLVNQFVDRTKRDFEHTFFGRGIVAHIAFANPVCEELRKLLLKSAKSLKARVHDGGTYVNMEGPAFSTRAESLTNHKLGYDVIGMTNLGEAKCSREAEIAYATIAMVTDYDCWKVDEEHVTLEMIVENLHKNAELARAIIARAIPQIPESPEWPCHDALRSAILTDKRLWPKKPAAELRPILAKYS